jgi:hypothetical protein
MKYSSESLDFAIEYILPHVKQAKQAGAPIQQARPQLMKDVAVEYFTRHIPFNQEELFCFSVVREAMRELSKKGELTFGELDLLSEIKSHFTQYSARPDSLN